LEVKFESQELRRAVPGEGVPDLGMVKFFSDDSLLMNAGLCGVCAGGVAGASLGGCISPF
jgi:hypothetical protein